MRYNLYIRGNLRAAGVSSLKVEELLMTVYRLIRTQDVRVEEC